MGLLQFLNRFNIDFGKRRGAGIYFNFADTKKQPVTEEEIRALVAEQIGGYKAELRGEREAIENILNSNRLGDNLIKCLYDFNGLRATGGVFQVGQLGNNSSIPEVNIAPQAAPIWGTTGKPPERIAKKPIEVKEELIYQPFELSMKDLPEKIAMCKRKLGMISQTFAKAELEGMIERLELRLKYDQFKDFFERFPNTTEEKIDDLLNKYQLVMKPPDIFISEFPEDAIQVMNDYKEKVKALSGKLPVFFVIAEEKAFEKAYIKKDPIILAQSPFGFFYQILGAWDKEMILLSEL